MGKIAESIATRVQKIIADSPAESASTSEPTAAAPPTSGGSEVESASAGSAPALGDVAASPEASTSKHDVLAEKLAAIRDQRKRAKAESRLSEREQSIADKERQADEARTAAAAERSKYEALRTGSFRETLVALGRDPREAFKEMQQEAIEAGKPEAEIRRMRSDFEKQMGEKLKPLEDTINELKRQNEELLEDRKQNAAEQAHRAFVADYSETVKDEAYVDLRVEYGERRLFNLVDGMKKNPGQLRAYAKELGVKLTFSDNRFNMKDILNVLDAAHKQHDTERKQRRDQMQAPTTSPGAPPQAPANAKTVNGTAERRNAETNPLGNESAASKASAPVDRPRLGKQARLERALERNANRTANRS